MCSRGVTPISHSAICNMQERDRDLFLFRSISNNYHVCWHSRHSEALHLINIPLALSFTASVVFSPCFSFSVSFSSLSLILPACWTCFFLPLSKSKSHLLTCASTRANAKQSNVHPYITLRIFLWSCVTDMFVSS